LTIGIPLEEEDARRWQRYKIMKTMGWSYREYRQAPISLVKEIGAFILTEEKATADSARK